MYAKFCTMLGCKVLLLGLMLGATAQAQRSNGDVGIGLQFGEPSGLSVGAYRSSGMSLDLLAAWDLDEFFYLNAHGLFTKRLGNDPEVDLFFGPGAFVGFFGEGQQDFDLRAGISGTAGLSLWIGPFEVYIRATPRLRLIEETRAEIGGGLGMRWWF